MTVSDVSSDCVVRELTLRVRVIESALIRYYDDDTECVATVL